MPPFVVPGLMHTHPEVMPGPMQLWGLMFFLINYSGL